MFKALEEKGITKSDLLKTATIEIQNARSNEAYKVSSEDVAKSRHPKKYCKLCGQPGCEVKFAGFYFHKRCLRQIRKDGLKMAGEN